MTDAISILGDVALWGMGLSLVVMLFDVLSGLCKALKTATFSSSLMRRGLWNKAGEIMALALAAVLQVGGAHFELGMADGIAAAVSLYICLMEVSSVLENIAELSPALAATRFMQLFASTKATSQDGGERAEKPKGEEEEKGEA